MPEPGWRPDPAWGAAPAGWIFRPNDARKAQTLAAVNAVLIGLVGAVYGAILSSQGNGPAYWFVAVLAIAVLVGTHVLALLASIEATYAMRAGAWSRTHYTPFEQDFWKSVDFVYRIVTGMHGQVSVDSVPGDTRFALRSNSRSIDMRVQDQGDHWLRPVREQLAVATEISPNNRSRTCQPCWRARPGGEGRDRCRKWF